MFDWYVRLLANRPLVVLGAVALVATACALLAGLLVPLPDFTDPAAGFVTRGTPLHGAYAAWANLVDNTGVGNEPDKLLSTYPLPPQQQQLLLSPTRSPPRQVTSVPNGRRTSRRRSTISVTPAAAGWNSGSSRVPEGSSRRNASAARSSSRRGYGAAVAEAGDDLYEGAVHCETEPDIRYARLIFESEDHGDNANDGSGSSSRGDIFTAQAIHSMCAYEARARALPSYSALWSPSGANAPNSSRGCSFISLGTIVVLLTNATSCLSVDESHMEAFAELVDECAPFYGLHSSKSSCWSKDVTSESGGGGGFVPSGFSSCPTEVPQRCRRPEVFNLFHYFVDRQSYADGWKRPRPRYVPAFLPLVESERLVYLYDDLQQLKPEALRLLPSERSSGVTSPVTIRVVAAQFGLKQITFERTMRLDTIWIAAATALVVTVLFLFTRSFFVAVASVVGMAAVMAVSYSLYCLAFGIDFFPFVNLLTAIVVVGVGADGLLIFAAAWHSVKASKNERSLEAMVRESLCAAGSSTLATSLTTAGAFYAGAFSNVLALRCFCLYAGTAVLACYVLSVTWTPACFVTLERWALCTSFSYCWHRCSHGDGSDRCCNSNAVRPALLLPVRAVVVRLASVASAAGGGCRRRLLDALCWSWLFLLTALGVASVVCLVYWPGFRPAATATAAADSFPLLPEEHPFEVYEARMRTRFDFELAGREAAPLPLYFVWGVLPEFDGDFFDLRSGGRLRFDEDFDVASPEAQRWLMASFCGGLRTSGLVAASPLPGGSDPGSCFVEDLAVYIEQQTCNSSYATPPCCDGGGAEAGSGGANDSATGTFPFERNFFERCLEVWSTTANRYRLSKRHDPGVRFFSSNGSAAVIVLRFWANVSRLATAVDHWATAGAGNLYSNNYYDRLDAWFDECLADAPPSMRRGFVVTGDAMPLVDDLRRSVLRSVPLSLLITAGVTAAIVFICTLNPALLLYAVATVAWAAAATLAALVLLGWELGVLESVVISLAVGLSMDYTLHYVVAYRLSDSASRSPRQRAADALLAVGDSVIYAALTTFVAGACVLPAGVLAYRRLGTFLTIMAAVSWLYATLYLPLLLCLAGPPGECLQLRLPVDECWSCVLRVFRHCFGGGRGARLGGMRGGNGSKAKLQVERNAAVRSVHRDGLRQVHDATSISAGPSSLLLGNGTAPTSSDLERAPLAHQRLGDARWPPPVPEADEEAEAAVAEQEVAVLLLSGISAGSPDIGGTADDRGGSLAEVVEVETCA